MSTGRETAIEVKVGALVLFSLALLGGFIYLLGDFGFDEGSTVYVDYQDIAGLKPGAKVKQGGITVGKVESITFMDGEVNEASGDPVWARVELQIEEERFSAIRESSVFSITSEGVLGEKFVSIRTSDVGAEGVDDGHVFRGSDPLRIEEMVNKVSKSLDSLNQLLNSDDLPLADLVKHIDQLVVHTDEILVENRPRIKSLLANTDELMVTANDTIEENRAGVKSLIGNADGLATEARTVIQRVDRIAGRLDQDFGPLMRRVSAVLANAEDLSASLLRMSSDAEPKVKTILDDVAVAATDVRSSAGEVQELVQWVSEGRGTVGLLIRDEEIFDNLREMLRELKRRPWKIVWKE